MDVLPPIFDALGSFDGISLGCAIQVPIFVVPVWRLPRRKIPAHLEIERDGDQGLVARRLRLVAGQCADAAGGGKCRSDGERPDDEIPSVAVPPSAPPDVEGCAESPYQNKIRARPR